jgi:SAM-dependent methyltransferase
MRVLDVACGSANAAFIAARAGAKVFGLDASLRLIDVARGRVPDGTFLIGDAAELPFGDGVFDGVVSVFGVIFAAPAAKAAAELARVTRSGGHVVLTTWPRRGPLYAVVSLMREAMTRVRPPEGPPPVNWGDPAVLEQLLGKYGRLEIGEGELAHDTRVSPEQVWDRWERMHPMWIRARNLLEPAGGMASAARGVDRIDVGRRAKRHDRESLPFGQAHANMTCARGGCLGRSIVATQITDACGHEAIQRARRRRAAANAMTPLPERTIPPIKVRSLLPRAPSSNTAEITSHASIRRLSLAAALANREERLAASVRQPIVSWWPPNARSSSLGSGKPCVSGA